MPCYESLNIDLLGRIEAVECGVVADCSRAAVACCHPVPVNLEPYAYLRIGIIKCLAIARVLRCVLEDSVRVAERLTARVGTATVRRQVFCPAFPADGPVFDDRVCCQ